MTDSTTTRITTQMMFAIPLGTCTVPKFICDPIKKFPAMTQHDTRTFTYQTTPEMYNVLKDHSDLKRELTSLFSTWINSIQRNNQTWVMTTNWVTENPDGSHMSMHNHTNCMYSAVLYFDKHDENHPPLRFYNPFALNTQRTIHTTGAVSNPFTNYCYTAPIGEGTMIMFPSFLFHEHDPFEPTSNRKSFACNFFPIGVFGGADSTLDTNWLKYDE